MAIARKYNDQLDFWKDKIKRGMDYQEENSARYHTFRDYMYRTTLSDDIRAVLSDRMFPDIEFNIVEMFVSRLVGEFAEQEPSVALSAKGDNAPSYAEVQFLEDHLRYIMSDFKTDGMAFDIIKQTLSGGFSGLKLFPDYKNEMAFEQEIFIEVPEDPTLYIFDSQAKKSHKGDGKFCAELIPMTKEDIENKFGSKIANSINYKSAFGQFSWSYENSRDKVGILVSMRYKEFKETKIVDVTGMGSMTYDQYDQLEEAWYKSANPFPMPAIIQSRKTMLPIIHHLEFIDNQIISAKKTNYRYLDLIFVDGNSAMLRKNKNTNVIQMTRPYIYNLKGVQDFKNFVAQTWANYIENMVQTKWLIPDGGIPDGGENPYKDPQTASSAFYNAYDKDNPEKQLPPPTLITPPQMPPEVAQAFSVMDQTSQMVSGSFNASLGINDNQLSGKAIIEGASQSNPVAMPYIFNYLKAFNQAGRVYLDLYPKVVLKRSKAYATVKTKAGDVIDLTLSDLTTSFKFDTSTLKISVEAGPNFAIQKHRALQQIIGLMQAAPGFAEFMNTIALPVLVKNLDIEGIDQLQDMATQWTQQQQQIKQQQMQQQANMPNPAMMQMQVEMGKLQLQMQKLMKEAHDSEVDAQLKATDLAIQDKNADTQRAKVMSEIGQKQSTVEIARDKATAEIARAQADVAIKAADSQHGHAMDILSLHHDNQHKEKDRMQKDSHEMVKHLVTLEQQEAQNQQAQNEVNNESI